MNHDEKEHEQPFSHNLYLSYAPSVICGIFKVLP